MARYETELASTGRAKCRGCEQAIGKGTLRFAEILPNPRADDRETPFWYHPNCAAYKRPEAVLAFLDEGGDLPDPAELRRIAEVGVAHPRMARLYVAHVSPSARATCRSCRELIDKDEWRVSLVFFEDGYLNPAGYLHVGCIGAYTGTTETAMERIRHFAPELSPGQLAEIQALVAG